VFVDLSGPAHHSVQNARTQIVADRRVESVRWSARAAGAWCLTFFRHYHPVLVSTAV